VGAVRNDPHHRVLVTIERHRPILRIARTQRTERAPAFGDVLDHRSPPLHQKERERAPILRVVVGHHGHRGILRDVAHALHAEAVLPLRLGVDHEVEGRPDERVAEGNDVRCARRVGRRETSDAMTRQEGACRAIKDGGHRRMGRAP
jgi:hypothetical protein